MTTNNYENVVEHLEKLKEEDEEQFIEEVKALSDEDFVGVYKEKSYVGTDEGIFGYFGDVYFNNEDIGKYLVDKWHVLETKIIPDELKDKMMIWKNVLYESIEYRRENGYISPEKAIEEMKEASDRVDDMIEAYEENCLEFLIELYQKHEDEIDTYFILEQRDRIIEDLEDEYP